MPRAGDKDQIYELSDHQLEIIYVVEELLLASMLLKLKYTLRMFGNNDSRLNENCL